jgi:hypothetical protein
MELDPGIHIVMDSVCPLKTGCDTNKTKDYVTISEHDLLEKK